MVISLPSVQLINGSQLGIGNVSIYLLHISFKDTGYEKASYLDVFFEKIGIYFVSYFQSQLLCCWGSQYYSIGIFCTAEGRHLSLCYPVFDKCLVIVLADAFEDDSFIVTVGLYNAELCR